MTLMTDDTNLAVVVLSSCVFGVQKIAKAIFRITNTINNMKAT